MVKYIYLSEKMFIIELMVNVEFITDKIVSVSFDSGKHSNLLSLDVIRKLTEVATI